MFCNNCGQQIRDGSIFCKYCGTRLAPQVSQPIMQPEVKQVTKPEIERVNQPMQVHAERPIQASAPPPPPADRIANATPAPPPPQRRTPMEIPMIFVQGGTFTMGCTFSEHGSDCNDDEKPAHAVTVNSFSIGKYPVTQGLWKAITGTTLQQHRNKTGAALTNSGESNNYPMFDVSWDDVQAFIAKLNRLTGKTYRLPTEAEWEYAARGGNKSRGFRFSGSNNLNDVAWFFENSGNNVHPVGTKNPNELGIYDMCGNVWEWCSDWYDTNYYGSSPTSNPKGPASGSYRIYRGGSWYNSASYCRMSARFSDLPDSHTSDLGFRIALSV